MSTNATEFGYKPQDAERAGPTGPTEVVITDVRMPIASLVTLLIKFWIANIVAIVLIGIVLLTVAVLIAMLFGGFKGL